MHDCIIDKTCIDRINEHNTDCFQKEPIKESPVCEMSSLKRIGIGDNHENFHFTRHCINRFLYSHLVCCCIVNCDFQEFLCTVTCIKNLLLSNLNDKPQRHLTLNHIENNCYHPYNHLPHNGLPLWHVSASCIFQFLL